jgi:hypothetical protein
VSVNGNLFEDKTCTFTLESTHFMFIKCPIYTHDGASAKFITNSKETDYSVITDYSSPALPSYYGYSWEANLVLMEVQAARIT